MHSRKKCVPTLPKISRPVTGRTLIWPKLLLGMGIIVYYFCIKDLFTGAVQQHSISWPKNT